MNSPVSFPQRAGAEKVFKSLVFFNRKAGLYFFFERCESNGVPELKWGTFFLKEF